MKRSFVGVLLTVGLFAGLLGVPAEAQIIDCALRPSTAEDHQVVSSDGTKIAITVFKPLLARSETDSCGGPVPVILTLHGWSGSRAKSVDQVDDFLDRGYGVIGIDARGHGDSGGQALVHHPSREVNDFRAVMDWVYDNVDWIIREGPSTRKDFRVGASGGSYGGGFQLMTAAFDDRLDALVPVVTWNNLVESLGPAGVAKTDWVSLLYAAGKLSVDMDRRIDEWFLESMATNRPPQAFVDSFSESSPFHWMQNIDVPTFIVQGMPDTLFPLNEAVANYIGIRNNFRNTFPFDDEVPVWLYGVNTGHVLPAVQPTGIGDIPTRTNDGACGDLDALTWDFYDAFLRHDAAAFDRLWDTARVAIPTEQGDCVRGADWPVASDELSFDFPALAIPQGAGTQLHPLFTADEETVIAGIPELRSTVIAELDDIFFLSLVLETPDGLHVINDQVQAARTQLASVEGTYNRDLVGVATTMQPGDTLYLRIDGLNEQYVANGNRRPGLALLTAVTLTVPVAG